MALKSKLCNILVFAPDCLVLVFDGLSVFFLLSLQDLVLVPDGLVLVPDGLVFLLNHLEKVLLGHFAGQSRIMALQGFNLRCDLNLTFCKVV